MEISQVLKWDIDINTGERQIGFVDEPRKKRYFVFGGDLFDKGDGDIRLAHLFLKFKSRFPDRVFFLVGNRDINKIKLTAELDQSEVEGSRLDDLSGVVCHNNFHLINLSGPYWEPPSSRVSPKQYLRSLLQHSLTEAEKQRHFVASKGDYDSTIYRKFDTRVNRLKYLLKHTMNCLSTFEFRRTEMATLRGKGYPILLTTYTNTTYRSTS